MFIPFICAFLDKVTEDKEDWELTKVNRLYSELVVEIYSRLLE